MLRRLWTFLLAGVLVLVGAPCFAQPTPSQKPDTTLAPLAIRTKLAPGYTIPVVDISGERDRRKPAPCQHLLGMAGFRNPVVGSESKAAHTLRDRGWARAHDYCWRCRVRPKPLEGYFCLFPDGRVEGPVEEDVLLGPGSRLIYLREGEPPTKV